MSIESAATSGDPSYLRRLNLQSVLRLLHAGGVHTITELARAAQLSRPTTKQAIVDLVEVGWASQADPSDRPLNALGRPAQGFAFRPEAGHVLGVDIGAYKAVALISDLNGSVVSRARRDVDPTWGAARRLSALDDVIADSLNGFEPGVEAISDGAIATPGVISLDGYVAHSPAVREWEGQHLGDHVQAKFGFPTQAANDVRMAALAEHWVGAAKYATDIVYLHAGRRIGTALLIGGRPHLGHHGASAEIGLWRGLKWADAYDRFLLHTDPAERNVGNDVQQIFEAAAAGKAAAQTRINDFAEAIGEGLGPTIVAIDPELLVIGGGMSAAGEAFAGPLRARITQETPFPPDVVCSALGDESGALGAVRLALDSAEARLFSELAPPSARAVAN